ncbi:hypothetical protein P879_00210 [Paragonimus westermani]|uniref:Kinesin-like protein n=1 Tax=Paragonimus westermani TaxID=34504 RepID=A0A8T0DSJ1_9TREM|nr:hypothetical protein P879_00210 [Paragonimus westermani]
MKHKSSAVTDVSKSSDACRLTAVDSMPYWGAPKKRGRIVVCVRKRPRNKKEISMGDMDVISIPTQDHIILCEPRQRFDLTEYLEHTTFRFDRCFDENATTAEVYRHTAAPMVSSIFQGYMATCFAYGQTGSGKTFTMGGPQSGSTNLPLIKGGIYGMVVRDLFALYDQSAYAKEFTVSVSFFEIYCNKVYDLLNRKMPLRVMEDAYGSVQLLGLREYLVKDAKTTISLLRQGYHLRTNWRTVVNEHSSRSHAIFQINIRRRLAKNRYGPDSESGENDQAPDASLSNYYPISSKPCNYPNPHYSGPLVGRFSLVDLAGSECSMDHGIASGDRVRQLESGEINKSLLALKECVRALGNNSNSYLPFRTSKLTQVLRESFVGKRSCTCMIVTISPGLSCCEHSMNTFRYAQRVKHLVPSAFVTKLTSKTPLRTSCWLPELDRSSDFGQRATLQNGGDICVSNGRNHPIVNRRQPLRRNTAKARIQRYSRLVSGLSSTDTSKRSQTPRSSSQLSSRLSEPSCSVRNLSVHAATLPNSMESSHSSTERVVTDVEILEHFVEPSQLSTRLEMEPSEGPKCIAAPSCVRGRSFTTKAGSTMSNKKLRFLRVQKQKQDLIKKHENFVKRLPQWIADHRKLLNRANKDKASMFAYVTLLTSRLNRDIDQLKKIQDDVLVLHCLQANCS